MEMVVSEMGEDCVLLRQQDEARIVSDERAVRPRIRGRARPNRFAQIVCLNTLLKNDRACDPASPRSFFRFFVHAISRHGSAEQSRPNGVLTAPQ